MSNSKTAYPVVLKPGARKKGYNVYIPDFDNNTQGNDLADALLMAQDAIEMVGVYLQDTDKLLPKPSDISEVEARDCDIVTLVPVDFDAYRRRTGRKPVKKTNMSKGDVILTLAAIIGATALVVSSISTIARCQWKNVENNLT
jgi:predicted RNase H-like HicB family nuclease